MLSKEDIEVKGNQEIQKVIKIIRTEGKKNNYIITITREGYVNYLYIKIIQENIDGKHAVLEARIDETYIGNENINDVDISVFVGTNNSNDKLKMSYNTKDNNNNPVQINKEYSKEDILALYKILYCDK